MNSLPQTPLVSILTPSYNTGAFIEQSLRGVEQQDYPRIEDIVLDSGSDDETRRCSRVTRRCDWWRPLRRG